MIPDNITLSQIRECENYDYKTIYDLLDRDLDEDEIDSPLCELENSEYYDPEQFTNMKLSSENCYSHFHLNCRSLSANWESFYQLLSEIHSEKLAIDFIGLSETFKCENDTRLKLPGYHELIVRNRVDSNRGGSWYICERKYNLRR